MHAPQKSLLVAAAVFFVALLGAYLATLRVEHGHVLDREGYILGRDFINFWFMGKAAWIADAAHFYDIDTYKKWIDAVVGFDYLYRMQWSYPPTVMLLAAPFGLLPYHVALLLFTATGIALLLFMLRRRTHIFWLALCSPAALLCLISGQSSMLTAVLQLAVFAHLKKRPVLTGILIGLLTLKPQLGLLYPVLLLATRQWKSFAVATATTLLLLAATALFFGPQVLIAYLGQGAPLQANVLTQHATVTAGLMPTMFIDAFTAGLSQNHAMLLQAAVSLLMVLLVAVHAPRLSGDRLMLFFAAASAAATPYLMAYDLLFLTIALVMCDTLWKEKRGRALVLAGYTLPIAHLVAIYTGIVGTALVPLFIAVWLVREKK